MNGVWRSLLWKEWREQRSKILILVVLTASLAPLPVLFKGDGAFPGVLVPIGLLGLLANGIFVGASLGASEQSQRTMGFLQSLPCEMSRAAIAKLSVATAKLSVATVLVASPWLVLVGLVEIWEWQGYMQGLPPLPRLSVLALAWASGSIAVWVAAIGVNLSDEVRAGAVGLLASAATWAAIVMVTEGLPIHNERIIQCLIAPAPGGPAVIFGELSDGPKRVAAGYPARSIWHVYLLAGLSSLGMTYLYQRRFGRVASPRRQSVETAAPVSEIKWLAPPMRQNWMAILWKQLYESLPLALVGAGAIFCVSLVVAVASRQYQHGIFNDDLLAMSISVWLMVGGLVSIVSGIGLWLDDLRPELHQFWRSRPISPDMWFAVKFVASSVITIATLALPSLLIYCGVAIMSGPSTQSLLGGDDGSMAVLIGLLSQFGLFCVAAAVMAIIRRPMVSALVTICLFFAVIAGLSTVAPLEMPVGGAAAIVVAISAIAIVVGWLSVRYDWAIGR